VRNVRVGAVQFQHAAGDKAFNIGRVRHFVSEAARQKVEILAFPEMCLTGYWHVRKLSSEAFRALAEPVPDGSCARELLRLSAETGMTIGAGLLEAADGRVYNSYVVAMPDGRWAVHRKLHVQHERVHPGDVLRGGRRQAVHVEDELLLGRGQLYRWPAIATEVQIVVPTP